MAKSTSPGLISLLAEDHSMKQQLQITMPDRHNYICLFHMKLDLISHRGINFFSKAKFHNNKYCTCNWQN